jgi:hypothetical protein
MESYLDISANAVNSKCMVLIIRFLFSSTSIITVKMNLHEILPTFYLWYTWWKRLRGDLRILFYD